MHFDDMMRRVIYAMFFSLFLVVQLEGFLDSLRGPDEVRAGPCRGDCRGNNYRYSSRRHQTTVVPCCLRPGLAFSGSALYWRIGGGGYPFGIFLSAQVPGGIAVDQILLLNPDYAWGERAAVRYMLPGFSISVGATYTHFQGSFSSSVRDTADLDLINPVLGPLALLGSVGASLSQMYDAFDAGGSVRVGAAWRAELQAIAFCHLFRFRERQNIQTFLENLDLGDEIMRFAQFRGGGLGVGLNGIALFLANSSCTPSCRLQGLFGQATVALLGLIGEEEATFSLTPGLLVEYPSAIVCHPGFRVEASLIWRADLCFMMVEVEAGIEAISYLDLLHVTPLDAEFVQEPAYRVNETRTLGGPYCRIGVRF